MSKKTAPAKSAKGKAPKTEKADKAKKTEKVEKITKAQKPAAKKEAKGAAPKVSPKPAATKAPAKGGKKDAAEEIKIAGPQTEGGEEAEDVDEDEGSSGGSAASFESEGGASEGSIASLKNFRHHPEMENFYRFIYENDLRFEALSILEKNVSDKKKPSTGKESRSGAKS